MKPGRFAYCGDEGGFNKKPCQPSRPRVREITDATRLRRFRHIDQVCDGSIDDAIEQATERDRGSLWASKSPYSHKRKNAFRRDLKRFLEQMPSGMSVAELLDEL